MQSLAYMLIQVEHSTINRVAQKLMKVKEITDLHKLYGEYDLIIKIEAENPAHLQDIISAKIRPIKNIGATETLITSDIY